MSNAARNLVVDFFRPFLADASLLNSSEPLPALAASLAKAAGKETDAFGPDAKTRKAVDEWLAKVQGDDASLANLESLDAHFRPLTFAVGNDLTVADLAIAGALGPKISALPAATQHTLPSLVRYVSHVSHLAAPSSAAGGSGGDDASSSTLKPFDPAFEGFPTIVRKDLAAEAKAKKAAAAAAKKAGGGDAAAGRDKAAEKAKAPVAAAAKEEAAPAAAAGAADPAAAEAKKAAKEAKKAAKAAANAGGGDAKGKEKKKGGNDAAPAGPARPLPSQIDLRVGKIVEIGRHPDADSLYLEKVDFGEADGPRTILSGLVKYVPIEEMKDRMVVGVVNLKPSKMRGIVSQGMLLCASSKEPLPETGDRGVEPIRPPKEAQPGDKVYVEGFEELQPEAVLNPKKKIWEAIQPFYSTTPNREAAYFGAGPEVETAEEAEKEEKRSLRIIRTKDGPCFADKFAGATLS